MKMSVVRKPQEASGELGTHTQHYSKKGTNLSDSAIHVSLKGVLKGLIFPYFLSNIIYTQSIQPLLDPLPYRGGEV